jgi:mRNA interferase MazF
MLPHRWTVCPLTTNPVEAPLIRIVVESNEATGIDQPSRIMVDKVTTMPRSNVRDRLGRLADEDLARLDSAFAVFLGLAD